MRITIVHSGALGDTLLLVPLINSLRSIYGSAYVTLVTRFSFGELLRQLGFIDEFISLDHPETRSWFGELSQPVSPSWAHCDLLLSAVSNGHDAWAQNARFSPAKQIAFFEPRPPADYPHHVTHYHRQQLLAQNIPLTEMRPLGCHALWGRGPVKHASAASTTLNNEILLHPGSGGISKCWPLVNFLTLAQKLSDVHQSCRFILGEAELERWPKPTLAHLQSTFPTTLCPSLIDFAHLIQSARLYIGNDSGPTHLAAVLGIPTLTLFGPSNPTQWLPIGPHVHLLHTNPLSSFSPQIVFETSEKILHHNHKLLVHDTNSFTKTTPQQ